MAYENGYGGAQYDVDLAWAYYLKAAQLGSPEAQMVLAQAYSEAGRHNDEAIMLRCAYEQGHGKAAYEMALNASITMNFKEAVQIYQNGVKFGSSECARDLRIIFNEGFIDRNSERERGIKAIGYPSRY